MLNRIVKLIKNVKALIASDQFKAKHCLEETAFTRNRKLSFQDIMYFILGLPRKSLPIELDLFFEDKAQSVSKQAFSKARYKVSSGAFEELFRMTTDIHDTPSRGTHPRHGHRSFGKRIYHQETSEDISFMKNWNSDKRKGFIWGVIAAAIAVVIISRAAVWLPASVNSERADSQSSYNKIRQIMSYINNVYMGDVDQAKLADSMFLGLVSGLDDPYSTYYTKEEYESVVMSQKGEFKGIGIVISTAVEDGKLTIINTLADGPAEKAGILAGDKILEINGEDVSEAATSDATTIIAAAPDDVVVMKIYRPDTDETLEFTMTKEVIKSISADGTMLTEDIGYIQIASFTAVTADQFSKKLEELREAGAKKFIFDLGSNPGGLVSAVTDTLEAFMPEGLLFYTEDKYGNRNEVTSSGKNAMTEPLVVLVNENSASASEIFTGAVKDHGVGTIVGTVTYGKGIVQDVYTLSDGTVVKLTIQHYYTPNGNDIHLKGITPDIEVENSETEDLQLAKAVEVLSH